MTTCLGSTRFVCCLMDTTMCGLTLTGSLKICLLQAFRFLPKFQNRCDKPYPSFAPARESESLKQEPNDLFCCFAKSTRTQLQQSYRSRYIRSVQHHCRTESVEDGPDSEHLSSPKQKTERSDPPQPHQDYIDHNCPPSNQKNFLVAILHTPPRCTRSWCTQNQLF